MSLRLDFISHKAADYAVRNFHYSQSMPKGKIVKIGVWEEGLFIGAVLFSRGANNHLLTRYGLKVTEGCELTRVALKSHVTPVTKILKVAMMLLKKKSPGLRLIVSFADSRQGHLGKIYQAGNWVYAGCMETTPDYLWNGKWRHVRTINIDISRGRLTREMANKLPQRPGGVRFRYLYPLDKDMSDKIEKLRKPYPQKVIQTLKRE